LQNTLKKNLGIVIFALFFISAINVNGGIVYNQINDLIEIKEIINERQIVVPNSNIILRLWDEKTVNGNILPYYSIIM